jgi:hypothetical protein
MPNQIFFKVPEQAIFVNCPFIVVMHIHVLMVERSINADQYIQNADQLGFIDAADQKHGRFGWILQQDGTPRRTSQVAMDWLEETFDVIADCPANSPDVWPIKVL